MYIYWFFISVKFAKILHVYNPGTFLVRFGFLSHAFFKIPMYCDLMSSEFEISDYFMVL